VLDVGVFSSKGLPLICVHTGDGADTRHLADRLERITPAQCLAALSQARHLIDALPAAGFTHEELESRLRALAETLGHKPGQLFGILRVAVTGQVVSPPLFETMLIVGREQVLARLGYAETQLAAANATPTELGRAAAP